MPSSNENALNLDLKIDGATSVKGDSGKSVDFKDGAYITFFQVDTCLDRPDYFQVELQLKAEHDFLWLDQIELGKPLELQVGYGDEHETVFKGEISYVEPRFSRDESRVSIGGYDFLHRLTRGQNSRTWGDGVEESEERKSIASTVIKDSKARKGDVSDSMSADTGGGEGKQAYLAQYNMNDFEWLQGLGAWTGATLDLRSATSDKKVLAKPLDTTAEPAVTVCREKPDPSDASLAISAQFRLSTVRQVARVEVRGWDPKEKKAIVGFCEAADAPFDGTTGKNAAGKAHYGSASAGQVLTIVDQPVQSEAEAEERAKAIFENLAMDYATGELELKGKPGLRAGDIVELKDFGKRYSGKWLVNGCVHSYAAGGGTPYTCRLSLSRNACPDP